MYYCSNCGVVVFVNRPENQDRTDEPSFEKICHVCSTNARYRKLFPEDLGAPNAVEVEERLTKLE